MNVANFKKVSWSAIAGLVLLPCLVVGAGQPLDHNPFDRPVLGQGSVRDLADSDNDTQMILRATLVAGKKSTANINGKFIRLGETVNGYKLVSVKEGKAVFQKDGIPLTIAVFDAILDGQNGEY